ncbi:hypothetical protein [Sphingomonas sp. UNC305MFCol5.2]|uniref:hypothetical protein n=1 Tax=Sphingomonas sp. UNC305MFCol5.2 TaxID=1449076 RepID=UPI0018CC3B06|nr:hypothetical protein [Sphingomonas sp. UNC305MFCol5.2]
MNADIRSEDSLLMVRAGATTPMRMQFHPRTSRHAELVSVSTALQATSPLWHGGP